MALTYQAKVCPFKENIDLVKMINYKEYKYFYFTDWLNRVNQVNNE